MRPTLDNLLSQSPPTDAASLRRALDAARGELAQNRPVRRWRSQAVWAFVSTVAVVALVALVLLVTKQLELSVLLGRAPLCGLLWVTGAVCAWGSLSPRGKWAQRVGIALAMVSAGALVFSRGEAHAPPTLPEWVCTVSHLGVALGPLVVSLLALRSAAFRPVRAIVAGLSVGTTGALVGELACSRGWLHVAGYHLTAWALVAIVEVVVSRSLTSRSFAP